MTCSRVAIINRGRVVATNTPDQLMAQLRSGSAYELEINGDFDILQPRLRNIPGVKTAEMMIGNELLGNRYRVQIALDAGTDPGQEISAAVVGMGLGLYEMKRIQVSLEDVFLELTTEEQPVTEAEIEDGDEEGRAPDQPMTQPTDQPAEGA